MLRSIKVGSPDDDDQNNKLPTVDRLRMRKHIFISISRSQPEIRRKQVEMEERRAHVHV